MNPERFGVRNIKRISLRKIKKSFLQHYVILYAVCSVSAVFRSVKIRLATMHDIYNLKALKSHRSDCSILGDKTA